MDDPRTLIERPDVLAAGVIVFVILLSGPAGGVDFTAPRERDVGDGTATVEVLRPTGDTFQLTPGRFGANVTYVRIPDLVVEVERLEGRPRVRYDVSVPELNVDRQDTEVADSTGRLRVSLEDRALWNPAERTYEGRMVVEIQSFTNATTVLNRSIEVVPG